MFYKSNVENPNLVLFHYNQVVKDVNPISLECRSLILDSSDNWKVVSFPFRRFFEYEDQRGEDIRKKFDWSSAKIYEKFDGSITIMYFYKGKWRVSSTN